MLLPVLKDLNGKKKKRGIMMRSENYETSNKCEHNAGKT